ncbi:hypothetical protein [Undibacterium sp. Ji22W]|uniref:hypothetical protein n=1 Tax=Undibacterium sp. Ji22W TaxID=3413038 RepID=UPI003BF02900
MRRINGEFEVSNSELLKLLIFQIDRERRYVAEPMIHAGGTPISALEHFIDKELPLKLISICRCGDIMR